MRSNSDESIGGLGFYAKIVGVVLVIGLAIFIGLLAFARAAYAWGFLGAFADRVSSSCWDSPGSTTGATRRPRSESAPTAAV